MWSETRYGGSMSGTPRPRQRQRGEIETLPSGSLRVRVYAGIDPVTRKRRYLVETIPASPAAAQEAETVRARLLHEVREGRNQQVRELEDEIRDEAPAPVVGNASSLA